MQCGIELFFWAYVPSLNVHNLPAFRERADMFMLFLLAFDAARQPLATPATASLEPLHAWVYSLADRFLGLFNESCDAVHRSGCRPGCRRRVVGICPAIACARLRYRRRS